MVHVLAAVVGLSAIVVRSATAFTVVKLAGAAYLVYLGLATMRGARSGASPSPVEARSSRRVFVDGFVVNVLNPKTALFFLAFVPQFVDPGRGSPTVQLLVLGGLFIGLGFVTDGAYALGSAWVGGKVRPMAGARPWSRWLTGSVYLGLGAATALGGRSSTQ